jgi:mono/diheme cytochrome c family protein
MIARLVTADANLRIRRDLGALLLCAVLAGCNPVAGVRTPGPDKLTFHQDAARSGWNADEKILTPEAVSNTGLGLIWRSEPFEHYGDVPPRLYATPLYVDRVRLADGAYAGKTLSVIYAAAATGHVYAVNAFAEQGVPAGRILWRARLTDAPCDGGTTGILSTPVIDRRAQTLYVATCDTGKLWQVHALSLANGARRAGWPVAMTPDTIDRHGINRNGATKFPPELGLIQRGALNLSPDGRRLYVPFGTAGGAYAIGWLVSIDVRKPGIGSAFSVTATTAERQGGIWSAGGVSIDAEGRVHAATGANVEVVGKRLGIPGIFPASRHNWGQSILQFSDGTDGLKLTGTYTPFNYCDTQAADIDLGSSTPFAVDWPGGGTSKRRLLVMVGAKQGNAYLLDRDRLPGSLEMRPPCRRRSEQDGSLLAPESQPHLKARGPVSLFAPYSDSKGYLDQAKSRSTGAYYRDQNGRVHIFATGSAKTGESYDIAIPPSLVRLGIKATANQSPYLRITGYEARTALLNPGSPVISSHGGRDAIVWIFDPGGPRSQPSYGDRAPSAKLYAFDATSLRLLWKSPAGLLGPTGRYNEPTISRGHVFVGTDRIEAFALGPPKISPIDIQRGAQPASEPPSTNGDKGAAIFLARCASCHASGSPGIPAVGALSKFDRARIEDALRHGIMKPQAAGLSEADVEAVAKYLTNRTDP